MNNNKAIQWGALGLVATSLYSAVQYLRESQYALTDKVVLITGGSRGLGLVMARQLAKAGAKVAICARNAEELEAAEKQLHTISGEVLTISCDITQYSCLPTVLEQVTVRFGRLDVLINNAGQIVVSPYDNLTQKDFDRLHKVHVQAPMRLCQLAVEQFRKQGDGGRIVNISSVGGRVSIPHLLPYSASKFNLTGFSEGLAAAVRKEKIYVTTVTPGLMRTGSPRNVRVKGKVEEEYQWFKISDSLPLLSRNAEASARQIINALRRGSPALTIGFPAYMLQALHGIAPGLTTRIMSGVNRWILPEASAQKDDKFGYETQYEKDRTPITKLTDEAAANNNEMLKEKLD